MGQRPRARGAILVKARKVRHETRSARARRQSLLRLGVWIFLGLFVFSIVGVAIAFVRL